MSLDLLDAPLRVTWQIHRRNETLSGENLLVIAERLREDGVFFVLLEGAPLRHPEAARLIRRLGEASRVSLVCEPTPDELARLVPALPCAEVLLDATALDPRDFSRLQEAVERVRSQGYQPSLIFRPGRDNLLKLGEFLDFCRRVGVAKLKLPNTLIDDSLGRPAAADLPGPPQVEQLRKLVAGDPEGFRRGVDLEVHDLFLWEILFAGGEQGRSEYGGCQAGNSLGHIDAAGDLYPCSSWPLRLGSLLESSLYDLWQSPLRLRVRRDIEQLPACCRSCRDLPLCFGGCRGLAETFRMESQGRDLLCPGPR